MDKSVIASKTMWGTGVAGLVNSDKLLEELRILIQRH